MACGKTFTSLRIAEQQIQGKGLIPFLAPSIALIGQTLREWSADALKFLYAFCVCSDPEVSKAKTKNPYDQGMTGVEDLALPAITSIAKIVEQLKLAEKQHPNRLHVIFSTYQSIERVAEALKKTKKTVDLIVCDEAHRSTGVTLTSGDESHFIKVNDNIFIKADKRLYMTARPRIYGDRVKQKADEVLATLCSMDDEDLFGPEIYHLGFGEAVDKNLLSDYKVLVFTVNRNQISAKAQVEAAGDKKEIDTDDVTKLTGCLHALSKNMDYD
jgi:predicted helicase